MHKALLVFGLFLPSLAWAGDLRDTYYLVSAEAAGGFAFHSGLKEDIRSFVPTVGGSFGVRWEGDYELHLEFFHSSFDASVGGLPLEVGGLNQLGLVFNYSPRSFYGWFASGRAGWQSGSVLPELSADRFYAGAAIGYSWVPGREIDLRPALGIQLSPTSTSAGNQLWPILSLSVQVVFKMETLSQFFLSLLGARQRAI